MAVIDTSIKAILKAYYDAKSDLDFMKDEVAKGDSNESISEFNNTDIPMREREIEGYEKQLKSFGVNVLSSTFLNMMFEKTTLEDILEVYKVIPDEEKEKMLREGKITYLDKFLSKTEERKLNASVKEYEDGTNFLRGILSGMGVDVQALLDQVKGKKETDDESTGYGSITKKFNN